MKLEEAIGILTHISEIKALNNRPDEEQASKLGIEALKRELHYRSMNQPCYRRLLPGETE